MLAIVRVCDLPTSSAFRLFNCICQQHYLLASIDHVLTNSFHALKHGAHILACAHRRNGFVEGRSFIWIGQNTLSYSLFALFISETLKLECEIALRQNCVSFLRLSYKLRLEVSRVAGGVDVHVCVFLR